MNLSIPPVVSQWISVVFLIAGVIAALSPQVFPSYIPAGVIKDIIQTAGLITAVGSAMQALLHRYSSSDPGPGAPPDPPEVKQAALLVQSNEAARRLATFQKGNRP
jgi:hypothetical protein